jgi:hypothetical protein
MNKSFVFMFPVLNSSLSGGLNLIFRLMVKLSEQGGSNLKLMDYQGGLLKKMLDANGIEHEFIDISTTNFQNAITEDDVVFGLNNDIFLYPLIFKNNPRVLIFDVFPPFWSRLRVFKYLGLGWLDRFVIDKLVNNLINRNGLVVMEDISNHYITKYLQPSARPCEIVAVSLDFRKKSNCKGRVESKHINYCYMGRSIDWKVSPLARFLNDLDDVSDEVKPVLHIVCTDIIEFKKLLSLYLTKKSINNVEIMYYENLNEKELDDLFLAKVDVGLGMGTAALEFSSRNLPTVLLDFSVQHITNNYKYKWIFQVKNKTLGIDLNSTYGKERYGEGQPLPMIINDILKSYDHVAEHCYTYSIENHDLCNVSRRLSILMENTEVRVNELMSLTGSLKVLIQRLKKIKNGQLTFERI